MPNFWRVISEYRFFRYISVGLLNTGFSYLIYSLMLYLGLNYQVSNLLALVLGILFSFHTQGKIVFFNKGRIAFIKYLLAWIGIYFINIWIISILIDKFFDPYLSGAVATIPISIASYFILKFLVFNTGRKSMPIDIKGS